MVATAQAESADAWALNINECASEIVDVTLAATSLFTYGSKWFGCAVTGSADTCDIEYSMEVLKYASDTLKISGKVVHECLAPPSGVHGKCMAYVGYSGYNLFGSIVNVVSALDTCEMATTTVAEASALAETEASGATGTKLACSYDILMAIFKAAQATFYAMIMPNYCFGEEEAAVEEVTEDYAEYAEYADYADEDGEKIDESTALYLW